MTMTDTTSPAPSAPDPPAAKMFPTLKPKPHWLDACVALDENGFMETEPDPSREDMATARWPLSRTPHLLETSLPGVFPVGDQRGGNIKRVAPAVGEGD